MSHGNSSGPRSNLDRRTFLVASAASLVTAGIGLGAGRAAAADKIQLRLSSPATETDQRAVALTSVFGPAVASFANFEPHWNATLFKQGTELEAIARGNLEMSITSPQELATIIPAWSIFSAGYLLRDADHQKKVFASSIMDAIPQLSAIHRYLPTHYWLSFADLLRDPINVSGVVPGLLSALAYLAIFGSAAWARFSGRDVTS